MSFEPLRDELNNILNIIADISENDNETDVYDHAIITRVFPNNSSIMQFLNY